MKNNIIYKKSDLQCVGVVSDNMTIEQEIELNVIRNFGGMIEDYGYIETEKTNFHLELVDNIVAAIDNPSITQPNQDDYLLELDYRLSKIELGL